MAEKGVVIRPSFCEAMKSLEKEDQLDLFWAICNYGIYGAEPQGLSTLAGAFFTLMQPSLEAAATRYSASVAGGASGDPIQRQRCRWCIRRCPQGKPECAEEKAGKTTGGGHRKQRSSP